MHVLVFGRRMSLKKPLGLRTALGQPAQRRQAAQVRSLLVRTNSTDRRVLEVVKMLDSIGMTDTHMSRHT